MIYRLIIILSLLLIAPHGYGDILDPTKPPKKVAVKKSIETEKLILNMVKLDQKTGKHTAIINGMRVIIGGMYRDAQIISIDMNAVELNGPKGEQIILRLLKKKYRIQTGSGVGAELYDDIKVETKHARERNVYVEH